MRIWLLRHFPLEHTSPVGQSNPVDRAFLLTSDLGTAGVKSRPCIAVDLFRKRRVWNTAQHLSFSRCTRCSIPVFSEHGADQSRRSSRWL